ncbi:MAG: universal stress protein [Saprospiraceae bacterium]|nr:universal stress protein [Saprospiraceae bacterium]
MKAQILVPVDFTENAFNAYLYANNLAYFLDCTLHLVHVVLPPVPVEGIPLPLEEQASEKVLTQLKSFSHWHPNEHEDRFHPVETTYEVLHGSAAAMIVKKSDPTLHRFIVCGTRRKHSVADKWLGTVSSEIASSAKVPVLLVPSTARFTNLDNIVVACDEHANDDYILAQIAILSDWFESKVHFVHVKSDTNDKFEFVERDILDTLLAYQKKVLNVQVANIEGLDVVESVYGYAKEHKAELLIYISERRNFLQQIIFRSLSRQAALNARIPTLIMHDS